MKTEQWSDLSEERKKGWMGGFITALMFHANKSEAGARELAQLWRSMLEGNVIGRVAADGEDSPDEPAPHRQ